jgi:hypothetical protein
MTTALGSHLCIGIDCEYCAAVETVMAGERELLRRATPKHATGKRRAKAAPVVATEDFNARWAEYKNEFAQEEIARDQAAEEAKMRAETAPLQQSIADANGPFVATPGNLKTATNTKAFIFAGNAYFTVRSLKTGTRYTYRVNRAKCSRCGKEDCNCWAYPTYFVSLLSGPDNTGDYTYLGMIRENVFRLTRASKMTDDSRPVKAFRWVIERIIRGELPPFTELWHEGRCGRCGRMLTVPESVERGIGPECAGRMGL